MAVTGPAAGAAHDSVGMSQLNVHGDDSAVWVGARSTGGGAGGAADGSLALAGPGGAVVLPEGVYDVNGQQLDTRRSNSWLLKLGEVATVEAAEVMTTANTEPRPMLLDPEPSPLSRLKQLPPRGSCSR